MPNRNFMRDKSELWFRSETMMKTFVRVVVVLLCCLFDSALATSQQPLLEDSEEQTELPPGHPPVGPAEVMEQAARAAENKRQRQTGLPEGHPDLPEGHPDLPADHPPTSQNPHAGQMAGHGEQRLAPDAHPSAEVATGSILVRVVDAQGLSVPDAALRLGILKGGGARLQRLATTDAQGQAQFSDLETGESAAYRVNLLRGKGQQSTTPFRLPEDQGYEVVMTQLALTEDERFIWQHGQFIMQLQDDKIQIIQHIQLTNFGQYLYSFPQEGKLVRLPKGFSAFRSQETMTDQHITEVAGVGFRITGSVPPGPVMLDFGYELPAEPGQMHIELPLVWNTYRYQVVSDAGGGLSLTVQGLPPVNEFPHEGKTVQMTELRRSPSDPQMPLLRITLEGIAGPSPWRWFALAIAVLVLAVGSGYAFFFHNPVKHNAQTLRLQQQRVLQQAAQLKQDMASDRIGKQYYERRHAEIVRHLAYLLSEQSKLGSSNKG